mmetsp:Transcript_28275/g.45549  ORF Transcript_28275/g.45549 Transcript_28275/m.45549 type:complete len:85 (+) Transcript_28275:2529-2783(+)
MYVLPVMNLASLSRLGVVVWFGCLLFWRVLLSNSIHLPHAVLCWLIPQLTVGLWACAHWTSRSPHLCPTHKPQTGTQEIKKLYP